MSSQQILPMVRQVLKRLTSVKGLDRLAAEVDLIEANLDGRMKFKCVVDETLVNGYGTLHGAYTSFLVDYTTSVALAGMNNYNAGVSVDMNVSFLNAAKIGDTVIAETKCDKIGRNLAFMNFRLSNAADGKLLATGKHTKYIGEGQTNTKHMGLDETAPEL